MWARWVNLALGIWLMAAPAVLDYGPPASINDRIVGPLVAAFATIAMWQVTRGLRWLNLLLALWLLVAPWILGYPIAREVANSLVVGTIMALASGVRGPIKHRVGGGWRALWQQDTPEPK
ncbi:SPW repeat domain-containing protein [Kallotenue papyrolyticum]|uniref:SPW repeat domain-containing protein n=1 Tax=Kallotenue papyrolyticum TaxID=1325125 RepID=UPI0004786611|nr:SPW repeat protein [Kallotenue papyrolyticum]